MHAIEALRDLTKPGVQNSSANDTTSSLLTTQEQIHFQAKRECAQRKPSRDNKRMSGRDNKRMTPPISSSAWHVLVSLGLIIDAPAYSWMHKKDKSVVRSQLQDYVEGKSSELSRADLLALIDATQVKVLQMADAIVTTANHALDDRIYKNIIPDAIYVDNAGMLSEIEVLSLLGPFPDIDLLCLITDIERAAISRSDTEFISGSEDLSTIERLVKAGHPCVTLDEAYRSVDNIVALISTVFYREHSNILPTKLKCHLQASSKTAWKNIMASEQAQCSLTFTTVLQQCLKIKHLHTTDATSSLDVPRLTNCAGPESRPPTLNTFAFMQVKSKSCLKACHTQAFL